MRTRRSGLIALACLLVAIALAALGANAADAHQDGCHRWHSCPSDTGSYVCGDLGYTSGCPGATPVVSPTTAPSTPPSTGPGSPAVSPPQPGAPANGATLTLGRDVDPTRGLTFRVASVAGKTLFARVTRATTVDANGILNDPSWYPITMADVGGGAFVGTLTGSTVVVGTYYWQAFVIDSSACATNACYLPGPVQSFTIAAAPAGPVSTTACAAATDERRLTALVKTARRNLKRARTRAGKVRWRRILERRRTALADTQDVVDEEC